MAERNISTKRTNRILFGTLLGTLLCLGIIALAIQFAGVTNSAQPAALPPVAAGGEAFTDSPPVLNVAQPSRLIIPSLGIDAHVQYVGVTASGTMGTPDNAYDVAWYKLGPRPGEDGSAVIAGHINTRYSAHGVFEHLENLNTGDEVSVVTSDGATLTFRVTGKTFLPYNDQNASADVFGPSGKTRLNLITCAGTWMPEKHVYDKRLVVYTELVGSSPA